MGDSGRRSRRWAPWDWFFGQAEKAAEEITGSADNTGEQGSQPVISPSMEGLKNALTADAVKDWKKEQTAKSMKKPSSGSVEVKGTQPLINPSPEGGPLNALIPDAVKDWNKEQSRKKPISGSVAAKGQNQLDSFDEVRAGSLDPLKREKLGGLDQPERKKPGGLPRKNALDPDAEWKLKKQFEKPISGSVEAKTKDGLDPFFEVRAGSLDPRKSEKLDGSDLPERKKLYGFDRKNALKVKPMKKGISKTFEEEGKRRVAATGSLAEWSGDWKKETKKGISGSLQAPVTEKWSESKGYGTLQNKAKKERLGEVADKKEEVTLEEMAQW